MEQTTYKRFADDAFALLHEATTVIITSHYSPDDDSIGSVLSVFALLLSKYPQKNIRIVYTGQKANRYESFAYFSRIEWVNDVANHTADVWIFLDASQYSRFSKNPENFKVEKTICIDHHASPADQFTLLMQVKGMSSNCELIYRIFADEDMLPLIAEPILLGILGDTSNFSHVIPDQVGVFEVAQKLVGAIGTSIDSFRARYGSIPLRVIPALQELVKNIQYGKITGWPDFQYTYISRHLIAELDLNDEELSAASHIYMGQYLPKVTGYSWGFVVTPRTDGTCRVSSRALSGSVNVRDMHERLGVGGGHDRASGGFLVQADPLLGIEKIMNWMKQNQPLFN